MPRSEHGSYEKRPDTTRRDQSTLGSIDANSGGSIDRGRTSFSTLAYVETAVAGDVPVCSSYAGFGSRRRNNAAPPGEGGRVRYARGERLPSCMDHSLCVRQFHLKPGLKGRRQKHPTSTRLPATLEDPTLQTYTAQAAVPHDGRNRADFG